MFRSGDRRLNSGAGGTSSRLRNVFNPLRAGDNVVSQENRSDIRDDTVGGRDARRRSTLFFNGRARQQWQDATTNRQSRGDLSTRITSALRRVTGPLGRRQDNSNVPADQQNEGGTGVIVDPLRYVPTDQQNEGGTGVIVDPLAQRFNNQQESAEPPPVPLHEVPFEEQEIVNGAYQPKNIGSSGDSAQRLQNQQGNFGVGERGDQNSESEVDPLDIMLRQKELRQTDQTTSGVTAPTDQVLRSRSSISEESNPEESSLGGRAGLSRTQTSDTGKGKQRAKAPGPYRPLLTPGNKSAQGQLQDLTREITRYKPQLAKEFSKIWQKLRQNRSTPDAQQTQQPLNSTTAGGSTARREAPLPTFEEPLIGADGEFLPPPPRDREAQPFYSDQRPQQSSNSDRGRSSQLETRNEGQIPSQQEQLDQPARDLGQEMNEILDKYWDQIDDADLTRALIAVVEGGDVANSSLMRQSVTDVRNSKATSETFSAFTQAMGDLSNIEPQGEAGDIRRENYSLLQAEADKRIASNQAGSSEQGVQLGGHRGNLSAFSQQPGDSQQGPEYDATQGTSGQGGIAENFDPTQRPQQRRQQQSNVNSAYDATQGTSGQGGIAENFDPTKHQRPSQQAGPGEWNPVEQQSEQVKRYQEVLPVQNDINEDRREIVGRYESKIDDVRLKIALLNAQEREIPYDSGFSSQAIINGIRSSQAGYAEFASFINAMSELYYQEPPGQQGDVRKANYKLLADEATKRQLSNRAGPSTQR